MHISVASRPPQVLQAAVEPSTPVTSGPGWLIIVTTFIAFALRAHDLTHESLLFDEALSLSFATPPLNSLYQYLAAKDIHPPAYELLLHAWLPLAGSSEFALRYLALLPGVLVVPLTYRLSISVLPRRGLGHVSIHRMRVHHRAHRDVLSAVEEPLPRLSGHLAAFLTATSLLLVRYSQTSRNYSLLVLVVLLATYAFARLVLREHVQRRDIVASGLALAVCGYVHYLALLVLPVQVLFSVLTRQGRRRIWYSALSWLIGVLAYVPWLPGAAQQLFRLRSTPDFFQGTLNLAGTLRMFLATNVSASLATHARFAFLVGGVVLLTAVVLHVGARHPHLASQRRGGLTLLVLSLVVPVSLTLAVMWKNPKYADRYFIASVPFVFLLIDAGVMAALRRIVTVPRRLRWLRIGALGVVTSMLCLAAGASLVQAGRPYAALTSRNEDGRGAVHYIQKQHQPGDAVFLVQDSSPLFQYYAGNTLGYQHVDWEGADPFFNLDTAVAGLNRLSSGHRRLWLVEWHTNWADPANFTKGQLEQHSDQAGDRHDFRGYSVTLYNLRPGETFSSAPNARTATSIPVGDAVRFKGGRLREQPLHPSDSDVHIDTWWDLTAPVTDPGLTITVTLMQGTTEWGHRDYMLSYPGSSVTTWGVGTTAWRYIDVNPLPGTPPGDYDIKVNLYSPAQGKILGPLILADTVRLSPPEHPMTPRQVEGLVGQPAAINQKGGVRLLGSSGAGLPAILAGQQIPVTLFWQAMEQPKAPVNATLLLQNTGGTTVAQAQRPVVPGYSFANWSQGDIYRDQWSFSVPGTVTSGSYRLLVRTSLGDEVPLSQVSVQGREHVLTQPRRPQRELDAVFGNIATLRGMDVDLSRAQPGGRLPLSLYWQSLGSSDVSYKVFVHVLAKNGDIGGRQHDAYPDNGDNPTTSWIPGEWIVDRHDVPLPPTTQPGTYRITVGLYDLQSGQRVALPDGNTELTAGEVEIH